MPSQAFSSSALAAVFLLRTSCCSSPTLGGVQISSGFMSSLAMSDCRRLRNWRGSGEHDQPVQSEQSCGEWGYTTARIPHVFFFRDNYSNAAVIIGPDWARGFALYTPGTPMVILRAPTTRLPSVDVSSLRSSPSTHSLLTPLRLSS